MDLSNVDNEKCVPTSASCLVVTSEPHFVPIRASLLPQPVEQSKPIVSQKSIAKVEAN
jgi:hypothetical protein